MTDFKDKEKAHENKYAFDKEQEFKIVARRNKLLGLWAAGLMDYSEDKSHEYAKAVVLSDFEEPGDEDVFRKVQGDLKQSGLSVSDADLRAKMAELMEEARRQIAEAR